jgi:uncharacterized membrane protein YfcA
MVYLIVAIVSFLVAGLTFFSGFGLGTLLLPLFVLFFSVPVAVAATAVVHLANNMFKVALVGKNADLRTVLLFGVPAAIAAVGGAWLLGRLSGMPEILAYSFSGNRFSITPIKLTIGSLMVVFAFFELVPALDRFAIPKKLIPLGGALSGFFGGLSGHQGALRTMFLVRAGLDKTAFIATVAVAAVIVDITRLIVYGATVLGGHFQTIGSRGMDLVVIATVAAFAGTFLGSRLLKKITMRTVRTIVGVLLFGIGAALAAGII